MKRTCSQRELRETEKGTFQSGANTSSLNFKQCIHFVKHFISIPTLNSNLLNLVKRFVTSSKNFTIKQSPAT